MSNSKELFWFYQPCSVTIHAKTGSHYVYVWRAFIDTFNNCLKIYGPIYILTHLLNKKNFQFFIKKTLPNILRSSLFIGKSAIKKKTQINFADGSCFLQNQIIN